jgi:hypothetical protein
MDQFSTLTPKQALFCDEYFTDFNASQAALRAGYSKATALSGNLMLLPKIKHHLQQRGAAAAEQAQVTQQMLLAELKAVGFARMGAFFGADGKPKAMNEVDEDTKAALLNYTVTEDKNGSTTVKIRMNNKLSALEKIARHIKFYDAERPGPDVTYWVLDGPALDEQDRFDDDSFAKKESAQEAEMNRRIAEAKKQAIAETEQRLKAGFKVKLKEVRKAAKEKMKNTHEYPRVAGQVVGDNTNNGGVVENQEARIKMQEAGIENQEARIKMQDKEVLAEVKVIGDLEGQYTPDGYLIKHDNPNRDTSSPYYSPYSGLYIEKKMGNTMLVKSYLPSNR